MKKDEIIFFRYCYTLKMHCNWPIRAVVEYFNFNGIIHRKRCWYLLSKWARFGFYNYGITLDLGWFKSPSIMPERYKQILVTYVVLHEVNEEVSCL